MPSLERLPRFSPISPEIDEALEQYAQAIERALNISAEAPLELSRGRTGATLRLRQPERAWFKLTGNVGPSYSWVELYPATGGGWTEGPRKGTTGVDPAFEWNANATVPPNTIVLVERDPTCGEWRFQADRCSS